MLLAFYLAFVVFFAVMGIAFRRGRGKALISGYNTMPEGEREKIDEKKLCKYMSRLMFLFAACWLVIASSEILKRMWILWLGVGLFFASCIGGVIYMNTGNRIKK